MHLSASLIVLGALALALAGNAFAAERRVALAIGNGDYTRAPKLENPRNDAAAVTAMLKSAGFDHVVSMADLGAAQMRRALRDFADMARDADVAVVFYAGHGIEVGGVNYLVPVDAALERDIDVQDEAIPLERITQVLESVRRLRLVILDACRDNPFARSMKRTLRTRSVRSGYAEIDERSLPTNTLIAYAQRAGATADDGTDRNSPYTTALLKHLPEPGVDIELALRRVRDEVLKATRNRQEPFKYGSLGGNELPLVPRAAGSARVAPSEGAARPPSNDAAREWAIVDKSSVPELRTFLSRHGASPEAAYARARLDEAMARERVAAASRPREPETPPAVPKPPPPVREAVAGTPFRVKSGVSEGIHNMRAGPGTGHGIVAAIPAGSDGVLVDLGSCRLPDDGRSSNRWCRARWQGRTGWVSMGGLTR